MVKNCPYDSFYKSLNRFLCLNTHSTFVKPWLLQFLCVCVCVKDLTSIQFLLCVLWLLFIPCFNSALQCWGEESQTIFLRLLCQVPPVDDTGICGGGREASSHSFSFFFLLWVVALEAAVPLPLSQLFKWYSPPLFLLLRWQLVPRWGPSSLVSLGFGKVAGMGAASCSYLFGFLRLPPFIFPASPHSVTNSLY